MSTLRLPLAGTTGHPLTRPEGLCIVRDCSRRACVVRVATTGVVVSYCAEHEEQASRLFDRIDDE